MQHQVLRRIAGDEQLGEEHEVGALARRIGARLARLGEIAGMSPTAGLSWATAMRKTSGADFLVMQAHVARPISPRNAVR